jgi:multiple sugar transport system permease protein
MLGFLAFIVFPAVSSLLLSFVEWNFLGGFGAIRWVGFDNFAKLLGGRDVWFNDAIRNTLIFSVVTVPAGLALGLAIAALIHRHTYAPDFLKAVAFIPYISSIVASVVVWQVVLQPSYGPINTILRSMGLANPPKWFVDPKWALPTLMLFQIWQTLGYNIVVFLAGLKGISPELYEAAAIDGASEARIFLSVTVPMISPTMFFLSTMGVISSFKVFDSIRLATQGGPGRATVVTAYYIYREAFEMYRMGMANACAWVMFILIFIVTMLQLRGQNRWVTYDA